MKAAVYNQENKPVGEMELSDSVFAAEWRPDLVRFVYLAQQANRRQPLAHARERGEVRGGGKKPWRQKGTGRARHGSIRSPLWKGGGATFGPRNDKDYSQKINRKVKSQALSSLLSKKLQDGFFRVVDNLDLAEAKTKAAAAVKNSFFGGKGGKVLFVVATGNKNFLRAARNLAGADSIRINSLDLVNCLDHKWLVFEQGAAAALNKEKAGSK